jgi:hypothetical protein
MTHRNDIQPTEQTITSPAADVRLPTGDDFIWAHSRLERITEKSLSDDRKVLMTVQNIKSITAGLRRSPRRAAAHSAPKI